MKLSHPTENTFTWGEWEQTLTDFNGLCAYCQSNPYEETEHFIPRTKGGQTVITNCLPACASCNKRKSNATGHVLVGLFGQETIGRLQNYLASRSDDPARLLARLQQQETPKKGVNARGPRLIIREICESRGIKQSDLVKMCGVQAPLISRYWNYPVRRVELDALAKIAKALGVKLVELIDTNDDLT